MTDHDGCAQALRDGMLAAGYQYAGVRLRGTLIVSTSRVVAPGLSEETFVCPHHVKYWVAPDAEMRQHLQNLDPDWAQPPPPPK